MRHVSLAARRAQRYLRRPPHPRWLRIVTCIGAGLLGSSMAFALSTWTLRGGPDAALERANDDLLAWSAELGLAVRDVYVEGRRLVYQHLKTRDLAGLYEAFRSVAALQ